MMHLLVVGGAGYIGSHVVLEAIERGFNVTVFDDLSTGLKENLNADINLVVGSTLSNKDLLKLFQDNNFDAVIYLAASKAAGESMLDPVKYAKNNIIGGINFLNACLENSIKYFVFSSSAAVYGLPESIPIDESHKLSPTNYYGYTKLAGEKHIMQISNKYLIISKRNGDLHQKMKVGTNKDGFVQYRNFSDEPLVMVVEEETPFIVILMYKPCANESQSYPQKNHSFFLQSI